MNVAYAAASSIFSLLLARPFAEGKDFVLVNGDIISAVELIAPLLSCSSPTAALVDSNVLIRDGEMNVIGEDDRIIRFSKEIPASEASAQSFQITKFGAEDSKHLFERVSDLIEAGAVDNFPAAAYDVVLCGAAMVPGAFMGGLWHEVDTTEDLHELRRLKPARGNRRVVS